MSIPRHEAEPNQPQGCALGQAACKSCLLVDYQKFAATTVSAAIGQDHQERAIFFALGLASEAGEVGGDVMKHEVYASDRASRGSIRKEIGDVLWYIANLCSEYDFSLSEVMTANVDKLRARFPELFTPKEAVLNVEH